MVFIGLESSLKEIYDEFAQSTSCHGHSWTRNKLFERNKCIQCMTLGLMIAMHLLAIASVVFISYEYFSGDTHKTQYNFVTNVKGNKKIPDITICHPK